MLDNQYGLTRFFAKSSILPDQLYKSLNVLEKEEMIKIKQVKYTVKYYSLTDTGRHLLKEHYSIDNLKKYLHTIEQTDFFITILEKIEASKIS
jgi:DNA-binding PadR family transcriptional regulator